MTLEKLELDPKVFDQRSKRTHYDPWVSHAKAAGLSEEKIAKQVDLWVSETESLAAGKCPLCGEPVARYIDRNHQPHAATIGTFVMYRCSTQPPPGTLRNPKGCLFMVDYQEPRQGS